MKEIQLWLGHSNFNTTANTYSHLDYSSKLHSAMTMEKCLNYTRAANEWEEKIEEKRGWNANRLKKQKVLTCEKPHKIKTFCLVGEDGFEPSKRRRNRFTVCPHWPLGNSPIFNKWSWWTDSNPRPADYKSTIRQHFNSKQKPMFLHSLHFQSPIAFTDFANDSERLIIISNVLRFVNT